MSNNYKKLIIEAIKDQQDLFGDLFFEKLETGDIPVSSGPVVDQKNVYKSEAAISENIFLEEFQKAGDLTALYENIHNCQKCSLGKTRNKFVFGVGNPSADAMLIGEAPGAEEDKQGEPFVGRAGKLLNDILKAINFNREDVYIANILKCRPPNNRDPQSSEMETCIPYLEKQVELIKPKVILCLGRIAANGLLNKKVSLSALRESIHEFNGIKVVVTYHPAALLRNPNWKRGCWEDVQKFKKIYDEEISR